MLYNHFIVLGIKLLNGNILNGMFYDSDIWSALGWINETAIIQQDALLWNTTYGKIFEETGLLFLQG